MVNAHHDPRLFEAFKRGVRKAFEYYVRLDGEKIYHFLLGKVKDQEIARVLANKVFLLSYNNRKIFRDEPQLRFCFFRTARRLYDAYHGGQAGPEYGVMDLVVSLDGCSIYEDADQVKSLILTALNQGAFRRLTARKRRILVFYYFRNMKTKDIAKKLGIARQTVLNHRSQAIKQLKKYLSPEWDENSVSLYS